MKLYKINHFLFLFITGIFIVTVSCETTEETFSQFTKGGEDILLGQPLSTNVQPGNLRAQFNIEITADPKINAGKIEWTKKDGTRTSHEFDILRTVSGSEIIEVLVDNIEEGIRSYTITMLGDDNLSSIPVNVTGTVLGPIYEGNLLSRGFTGILAIVGGETIISWSGISEGTTLTRIRYKNAMGDMQELEVANEETSTTITDIDLKGGIIILSDYFLEGAIDTFTSGEFKTTSIIANLNKSLWNQIELAGDAPPVAGPYALVNAWDNNDGNYGATLGGAPRKHHFTIDLGLQDPLAFNEFTWKGFPPFSPVEVKDYQLWGAADITNAETTTDINTDNDAWETEMENKGWVKLLEGTRPQGGENYKTSIPVMSEISFVRIVILTSYTPSNPDIAWGEINLIPEAIPTED